MPTRQIMSVSIPPNPIKPLYIVVQNHTKLNKIRYFSYRFALFNQILIIACISRNDHSLLGNFKCQSYLVNNPGMKLNILNQSTYTYSIKFEIVIGSNVLCLRESSLGYLSHRRTI